MSHSKFLALKILGNFQKYALKLLFTFDCNIMCNLGLFISNENQIYFQVKTAVPNFNTLPHEVKKTFQN